MFVPNLIIKTMMVMSIRTNILIVFMCCLMPSWSTQPPHIIFIIADDLGWNDVSFHGSNQISTPNIDSFCYNGLILNSFYVQSSSTQTRAALMAGKYPVHLGMQGQSLNAADTRSLPVGKIMPEYFKDLGYATHLVGKWHLGSSRRNETPTARGFDHHFGSYGGYASYYDYISGLKTAEGDEYFGFDLWRDNQPSWESVGQYATSLYTEEAIDIIQKHNSNTPLFLMLAHQAVHVGNEGKRLEAPQETINSFKHISNPNRRTYAAMVSELDDSLGAIVETLGSNQMLQNSLIVFISDNGAALEGQTRNWGSNFPLRGAKDTLHEGGVRAVACVYSPLFVQPARVSSDLFHITDWLPTLYTVANGENIDWIDVGIDGIDQWSSIMYDLPSARSDVLINIDEVSRSAALRIDNWKMIVGAGNKSSGDPADPEKLNIEDTPYNTTAVSESVVGKTVRKMTYSPLLPREYLSIRNRATIKCLSRTTKRTKCDYEGGAVCLFDIRSDPCEENDLTNFFPSVVRKMKRALVDYRKGLIEQQEMNSDIVNANPVLHDFTWAPWKNCTNESDC